VSSRGADPLNFFIPHPFIYLGSDKLYQSFVSPFESTSYYGLVGLVAVFSLIFFWKKISIPQKWLWLTALIVFMLIALGEFWQAGGRRIPMPFSVLENFPPFNRLRAPNRFFVFSYLSATVIFSYFLLYLKSIIKVRLRVILTILLLILIASERMIIPYPLVSVKISAFYKELGRNNENFAIVDLPIINPGLSVYNHYQIYHKKPIVDAEYFWTAYSSQTFNFIKQNSLLLNSLICERKPTQTDLQTSLKHLADANVRYVVVHNFVLHDYECPTVTKFIREFFANRKAVFADGEITVYSTIDKVQQ
jgi:hypothetical protein